MDMQNLQERLSEVMAKMGWEHADLMRISKQSSSVVSQWLGKGGKPTRSIGKQEAAEALSKESGFSALWIAKGLGPKLTAPKAPLAHALSHSPFNLRLVTREQVMTGEEQKGQFIYRLTDGAMASHAGQGARVVFDADLTPEPGDGVLLRTASGDALVRRMAMGKHAGHWRAVADDPIIYPTLDSSEDGLTVVAVWVAVLDQRLSRR
jgi:hypothetical protein